MGERDLVVWHDVECGGYDADLPLWRELAHEAGGAVLEVGAGTGRVSLDLAREGFEVTALDLEPGLLVALRERADRDGLAVETVAADARDFDLGRRFALVAVPMQTIQVLGGPEGRRGFLGCAAGHLAAGGLVAAALAVDLDSFHAAEPLPLPLPDMREEGNWVYSSQPVEMRTEKDVTVIARLRQMVSPQGERTESRDEVRLDCLDAAGLATEAAPLGFEALPARHVAPTTEYVGSDVALLRRV